jgi:hypothetical protein
MTRAIMSARLLGAGVALVLAAMPVAKAATVQTITFDDRRGIATLVQDGYQGFNWSNFVTLDGHNEAAGSGYDTGTVSQHNIALNSGGTDASLSRSMAFSLIGGYFTAAWNDGLSITLTGSLSGVEKFTRTFQVNTSGPVFAALNFSGIDRVRFHATGGVTRDPSLGNGTQFVLDDLKVSEVSAVPLPAAAPLFGAMLTGLCGLAWHRRQSTGASVG